MSREAAGLEALLRSLVVYRAVVGHSRQQDLVDHLLTTPPKDDEIVDTLRIDLSPPRRRQQSLQT